MDYNKEALKVHEELKGKLVVNSKIKLKTKEDFSVAYTPGVAEPCKKIFENPEDVFKYTLKSRTIAVISNGTAVLGLGDIGASAAIPVMEGKAAIFKEMADVDAFPICINSKNVDENVEIIKKIAPVFGGINLEDYKAPECFKIEQQLQDIGIPVMHDDQHGTAVVVLAGLINSLKVVSKKISDVKIAISGAGAAGIAVTKMILNYGAKGENIVLCDSKGAVNMKRDDLNEYKKQIAEKIRNTEGRLEDAVKGADVFIGVSKPEIVTKEMIKSMNKGAVVFAMSNPVPEIMPDEAIEAGAEIVATGRSDFPNQVNNALAFPGILKGALECRAKRITGKMKLAAAEAIASMIIPSKEKILPEIFNKDVAVKVSEAVKRAWIDPQD
jgi:malate dehydrogenase (oxaloacetate-decarboxylating)